MGQKCSKIKDDGTKCKAWAVRTSNPPLCSAHGGGKAPVGAPRNNTNAKTHGAYSGELPSDLDARISDLDTRVQQLARYIDTNLTDLTPEQYITLFNLQGSLTSRLGRLMRDRQTVTGDVDELDEAIKEALHVAGQILGTDLGGVTSPKKSTLPISAP